MIKAIAWISLSACLSRLSLSVEGNFDVGQPCWGLVFMRGGLCFHSRQHTRSEGVPENIDLSLETHFCGI